MEMIEKTPEKIDLITNMNISLANAIRRSVGEIPILAVYETDVYKNDTALYDEIIAHRLGLLPLKNQKLKASQTVEMKLKSKGKGEKTEVLSGEMGDDVVYPEMPIVLLEEGQELEVVARARVGKGKDHAKYIPGLIYYKYLPKIKLSGDGEKQTELVELYPDAFEMFGEKVKVKNAAACDLDQEDVEQYPGVAIDFDDNLVLSIESWGQIKAEDVFTEACKALKGNLSEVSKALK
jgi:DNA-directed RNA polymerase subunit D